MEVVDGLQEQGKDDERSSKVHHGGQPRGGKNGDLEGTLVSIPVVKPGSTKKIFQQQRSAKEQKS